MSASAVYEGTVTHRRHAPHAHAFTYRIAQLLIDLDEVETVFRGRWLWSVNHRNVAEWRRSDYLGPHHLSLEQAVRRLVARETGHAPTGPIRLLTHPRYLGYIFNPVSFYFCYESGGESLDSIVAEITNTPWGERHAYVLPVARAVSSGRVLGWQFEKIFHVSPFMSMQRRYAWNFTTPADRLQVHMSVLDDERPEFDATLVLRRRPLNGASLARILWRYPLMTMQVMGAIHWQALRLWVKGNPVHDHPARKQRLESRELQ